MPRQGLADPPAAAVKSFPALAFLATVGLVVALILLWKDPERERAPISAPPGTDAPSSKTSPELQPVNAAKGDERTSEPSVAAPAVPKERSGVQLQTAAFRGHRQDATPSTATLRVLLRSKDTGSPVANAHLRLAPAGVKRSEDRRNSPDVHSILLETATTDGRGMAEFQTRHGHDYQLRVGGGWDKVHPLTEIEVPALRLDETREVVFEIATEPNLVFVGRVAAAGSGRVLPGASGCIGALDEIIPGTEPRGPRPSVQPIAVGADGYFEVRSRSWQPRFARVEAPDHECLLVEIVPGHEDRGKARDLRLRRTATIEAIVVRPGIPRFAGARVRLSTSSLELMDRLEASFSFYPIPDVIWDQAAGDNGRCLFTGLPPGTALDVQVYAPRVPSHHEEHPISLEPGEVRRIELEMGGGATVTGILVDETGAPIGGAEICIQPATHEDPEYLHSGEQKGLRTTNTDAMGRFEVNDVYDGILAAASAPEGPYAPVSQTFRVEAGRASRELVLTARAGLFLRGIVLDAFGEPVPARAIDVLASAPDHSVVASETDEAGRFSIGPLPPGEFAVEAHVSPLLDREPMWDSEPLIAQAGDSGLVLKLRIGSHISGRIVDASSGLPLGAQVTLLRSSDESFWLSLATSDAPFGEFRFSNLQPESYDVLVTTKSGGFGILLGIELDAGTIKDNLQVNVKPGGRLRVQYAGTKPHAYIRVLQEGARVGLLWLGSGAVETTIVPAGVLVVECRELKPDRTVSRTVAVEVGRETEITFGED